MKRLILPFLFAVVVVGIPEAVKAFSWPLSQADEKP
jgi:hypothetical protein